ncbi:MAG: TIGR03862 family flavoprotein [Gammaproteobacteria bacterium]|nr:TIGR03862 family flavoprotein [Gammaproteobacteria bacterium]
MPSASLPSSPLVAVIGGGPAGLMAAEVLGAGGMRVELFDAMPSVGRKFLLAGKGGLNLTHAEALEAFLGRYGTRRARIEPLLEAFGPEALCAWAHGLGIETFVGSSGRVFPAEMKAAPLLRAWLHRMRGAGVRIHVRHRWRGWNDEGALLFDTPQGVHAARADAVVLALGGGSWPQLGSDASWVSVLGARGVAVMPLRPANCGFDVAWGAYFSERFAGQPLKSVVLTFTDPAGVTHRRRGEFIITAGGVEGGLIYALSAPLRDAIAADGAVTIQLDLTPDREPSRVIEALSRPRGSKSMANHLRRVLGIDGVKAGLLREYVSAADFAEPERLAAAIKALPLRLNATRPLAEAISTAGGVDFDALDEGLMIREMPGVFCAGEMLDWEAPTGGYLLTACFASGHAAGRGALAWLDAQSKINM